MATTTNYSWTTPDDSDLVKDGASAIRSLGAAIDGTFLGLGKNVVQTAKTDVFTTTANSFTDVTGLTVTITPSSDSAKILLIANVSASQSSAGAHFRLNGGNADDYVGGADGNKIRSAASFQSSGALQFWTSQAHMTMVYLDSPATTSAVTYAVQTRIGSGGTAVVNQAGIEVDNADYGRTASSLTAIEVYA